jgi:hypothetical protein
MLTNSCNAKVYDKLRMEITQRQKSEQPEYEKRWRPHHHEHHNNVLHLTICCFIVLPVHGTSALYGHHSLSPFQINHSCVVRQDGKESQLRQVSYPTHPKYRQNN